VGHQALVLVQKHSDLGIEERRLHLKDRRETIVEVDSVRGRFQAGLGPPAQMEGKSRPGTAALLAEIQYFQEVGYGVCDLANEDR
jgi:hypothetical protein